MSETVSRLRKAVIERALHGAGKLPGDVRYAAFHERGVPETAAPLAEKIARHAYKVTDEDVVAAKRAGLVEDEIFEFAVCASLGQATRQLDAALAAIEQATQETP